MPCVGYEEVGSWTNAQHRGVQGPSRSKGREEGTEAMSLWRRIVVLVVMASGMAFMSAPAAWAGGYDDDHGKKDDDKHYCKNDNDDKDHGNKDDDDDKDSCKKDDDDNDNDGKQNNRDDDDNDGIKDDDDDKDKKHYS